MQCNESGSKSASEMRETIAAMKRGLPELENIFNSFEPLLVGQAELKGCLNAVEWDGSLDPDDLFRGISFLSDKVLSIPPDYMSASADKLFPAMKIGFPKIVGPLERIEGKFEEHLKLLTICASEMPNCPEQKMDLLAKTFDIDPLILKFVVFQLVKPFAQKAAEAIPPLPEGIHWHKGYCPFCGSWPELSYLRSKEGRRWLSCSFCKYEWSFMRVKCPFCETENQEKLEIFFSEERKFERAELCRECMRYIVSLDLRDRLEEPNAASPLGLVYLDILAQEKGFSPGAVCAWNVIA